MKAWIILCIIVFAIIFIAGGAVAQGLLLDALTSALSVGQAMAGGG